MLSAAVLFARQSEIPPACSGSCDIDTRFRLHSPLYQGGQRQRASVYRPLSDANSRKLCNIVCLQDTSDRKHVSITPGSVFEKSLLRSVLSTLHPEGHDTDNSPQI